jgi:FkbM family methyltransferase
MLMQKGNGFRMHARSVFGRIFHLLLDQLGIRRFREHSFFGSLLARPAAVADFGAHRGEFFAALKAEYSICRTLLVEANPALAESLKRTFGNEADVLHAALVGGDSKGPVRFTRSRNPEGSSISSEWVAGAYGIVDQVDVPAVNLSEALRELGGRADLLKFDIEGAEVDVLQAASSSDLDRCVQLTVEFHDKRPPQTRRDVDRVCQRLRSDGYGVVNANWPHMNDVLFVNLKSMPAVRRLGFRCRVALANVLFIGRRKILDSAFVKRMYGTSCPCPGQ